MISGTLEDSSLKIVYHQTSVLQNGVNTSSNIFLKTRVLCAGFWDVWVCGVGVGGCVWGGWGGCGYMWGRARVCGGCVGCVCVCVCVKKLKFCTHLGHTIGSNFASMLHKYVSNNYEETLDFHC